MYGVSKRPLNMHVHSNQIKYFCTLFKNFSLEFLTNPLVFDISENFVSHVPRVPTGRSGRVFSHDFKERRFAYHESLKIRPYLRVHDS